MIHTLALTMLAAAASPTVGSSDCVYPSPHAVLGEDIGGVEKVEYLVLPGPWRETLRWLQISWGGPPGGAVFVLACDGHAIANLNLGYVVQAKYGPVIDGRETLEAIYIPASGPGLKAQSVALLQFDGKEIVKLWDHDSQVMQSAPYRLWDGPADDKRWRTETDIYTWSYAYPGPEISVGGIRGTEIEGSKATNDILPREKYCYRHEKHRFERCD